VISSDSKKNNGDQGFVLLDVILALFLFGLGFASLYGLAESAWKEAEQAIHLTEAANLAQSIIEELAAVSWTDNINSGRCLLDDSVEGGKDLYNWRLFIDWAIPDELLRVQVEVFWLEQGRIKNYTLEGLYAL
jgi:hypothetical protein